MQLIVNGNPMQADNIATIGDLLTEIQMHNRMIIVELNGTVVHRDQVRSTPVNEGDRLEIIQLMGGG